MRILLALPLLLLAACDKDPDARSSAGEARMVQQAVADVDAARAEAARSPIQSAPAAEPK